MSTAGSVSVMPYSWRGRQPSRVARRSYCSSDTFCANQQWRSRSDGSGVGSLARIIRIGAANSEAAVASSRAAWARKRDAEKAGTRATDAPAEIAAANE